MVTDRIRTLRSELGLGSRAAVAWALYDWANSAFATTVIAAVFPIYYRTVIGADLAGNLASVYFGYTSAIGLGLAALISPVLGAIADRYGLKKRFLGGFVSLGVLSTAGLFFTQEGDVILASALFVLGNVGFIGANVFYDSLLSHIDSEDPDKLSTTGYAIGFLGGGLLLIINLAWVLSPGTFGFPNATVATRVALLSVAVWWAVFSIPLFTSVPEPAPSRSQAGADNTAPVRAGFRRLRQTATELREYRELLLFLGAFLLYADGIGTIIRMASIYGAEIGIGRTSIIGALVLVQFLAIPFSFLFGSLPQHSVRIGQYRIDLSTKRTISLGLVVYIGIAVAAFFIQEAWQFWALAVAVATVQGGTQALSRSLYATLTPTAKSSEFFSFFSVSSKFAGVLGPALFGFVGQITGSSRFAVVSVLVFFIGGLVLLSRVDVEEGRQVAANRNPESTATPVSRGVDNI
jgi:UMF1 family MFS transporter